MLHETRIMLKSVSASGRLTLGKRYSGRHFEVEECASGELVLHPVRVVPDTVAPSRVKAGRTPAFQIAEVEQVMLSPRDQRKARHG